MSSLVLARHEACRWGCWANFALAIGWLTSLALLLCADISSLSGLTVLAGVLLRAQLQTGLFILGHDAMHRNLCVGRTRLNDGLGAIALALYAALPYRQCFVNHWRHHQAVSALEDPDLPAAANSGFLAWYQQFMGSYLTLPQMTCLLGGWAGLAALCSGSTPTAWINVLVFCTLPLLLSSFQLFVFGTYLPHRSQIKAGHRGQPESLDLHPFLSFLVCFHFGYHREHHDNPGLPWFDLPAAWKRSRAVALGCTSQ